MSEILLEETRNYYLNLREFASGEFEAILKATKPMKSEMMNAAMNGTSYAAACAEKGESSYSGFTFAKKEEEQKSEFDKASNLARAVRRSKQNIRFYAKAMEADRLFTLTYRENVTDRNQVLTDFKKFLRLVRKSFPDWQYIAVLEKQERGALHIHCAVKGWQRINFLRKCWHKALGHATEQTGENSPGNVNVTNPDKAKWGHTGRQWKVNKLAGYLTKYLSKTFDGETVGNRRYLHAKDLQQPVVQRFWINGENIVQAIKGTISLLGLHIGIRSDFNQWLSTSEDCYWIAGRCDA